VIYKGLHEARITPLKNMSKTWILLHLPMISKKSGSCIWQNKWFTTRIQGKVHIYLSISHQPHLGKSDDSHFLWCNRQFDISFFSPYFFWDCYLGCISFLVLENNFWFQEGHSVHKMTLNKEKSFNEVDEAA